MCFQRHLQVRAPAAADAAWAIERPAAAPQLLEVPPQPERQLPPNCSRGGMAAATAAAEAVAEAVAEVEAAATFAATGFSRPLLTAATDSRCSASSEDLHLYCSAPVQRRNATQAGERRGGEPTVDPQLSAPSEDLHLYRGAKHMAAAAAAAQASAQAGEAADPAAAAMKAPPLICQYLEVERHANPRPLVRINTPLQSRLFSACRC